MTQTQQPEALNLEEFRAKVTRAAREPLLSRIAELEAQLEAIGAGGVEPLRKQAVPAAPVSHVCFALYDSQGFYETRDTEQQCIDFCKHYNTRDALLGGGLAPYTYGALYATPQPPAAAPVAPAHPAVGMPEQTTRDAVIQHLTSAGVLEHDGCGIFIASGDASELIDACMAISATHPTQQGLDKVTLLSKDHTGMKVDYSGLLGQVRREIKRSAPGLAEMIRQLQEHMQELGQRWYAGDTAVVDELLQLYSVERQARDAIAAQAKQGEQANG